LPDKDLSRLARRGTQSLAFPLRLFWIEVAFSRTDYTEQKRGEKVMLNLALLFLVIALVAAVLGFSGIAAGFAQIAQVLFVVFLVLFLLSLIMGAAQRPI
jgi:uncharacterized membrane protein YtjA (UPF0391 family)